MNFEDIKVGKEYLVDGEQLICFHKEEGFYDNNEPYKKVAFNNKNKTVGMFLGEKDLHRVESFINMKDWDVSKVIKLGDMFRCC